MDQENVVCVYTMVYHSAPKMEQILPFATTRMSPESITPSEISQTDTARFHLDVESKISRTPQSREESSACQGLGAGGEAGQRVQSFGHMARISSADLTPGVAAVANDTVSTLGGGRGSIPRAVTQTPANNCDAMDVLISLIAAITPPQPEHHLEHLNLYHSYQGQGWERNKMHMDIRGGGRQREESEHPREPAVWRKPEIQSEL